MEKREKCNNSICWTVSYQRIWYITNKFLTVCYEKNQWKKERNYVAKEQQLDSNLCIE